MIWIVFVPESRAGEARRMWSDAASFVIRQTAIGHSGDGWFAGGAFEPVPLRHSNRIARMLFGDGPASDFFV